MPSRFRLIAPLLTTPLLIAPLLIGPLLIGPLLIANTPAAAQQPSAPAPVTGDAVAGLVSRSAGSEVHVLTDAKLSGRRAVLKIVVANRSGAPQPFGPDAVSVTADGQPVALATRAALIGTSDAAPPRDTSQSHATAALPVNGAGQTDVTGFTGGMAGTVGGVPGDTVGRAGRGGTDAGLAAQLDAVLLKPITVAAGQADGGQLFTDPLKRKTKRLDVTVAFAGDVHRFSFDAPR